MSKEPLHSYRRQGFVIVSGIPLTDQSLDQLVAALLDHSGGPTSALQGRRPIAFASVDGIGRVAVKHYGRGGLLGRLVETHFVRTGPSRSQVEFQLLRKAKNFGVPVPEPIAYAVRGLLFYEAWLITREVPDRKSLADLASAADERVVDLIAQTVDAVRLLIERKIFHVDLHPGNVLVGADAGIYLIDFDKARSFGGTCNELRELYLRRWRRAVLKHNLPDILIEAFGAGLRRSFAEA